MSYTRYYSDWKDYPDTSTPIVQAALDTMDQGIVDAHAATAKGDIVVAAAANDLRRLAVGSNDQALVADSAQTLGLKYAAIILQTLADAKGDLIVASAADAFTRLAVGSSGQVLTAGASSAISWATPAAGTISVTAALPGSPADGDEIILVDSTSAPTYAWHLRYISAKSSNKWQFVGGPPVVKSVTADESTAATAYTALTTAGPSFTLPVAGDYVVAIGAVMYGSAVSTTFHMSYDIGGTGAVDADSCQASWGSAGDPRIGSSFTQQKLGLTAVALTAKYRTTGGTAHWLKRWMTVVPIAVGG